MKKLKTLISVVLSAMLVLSLVVPSMAVDKYQVEVTNVKTGVPYTLYKIFNLEKAGNVVGDNIGVYTVSAAMKDFLVDNGAPGVVFEGTNSVGGLSYVASISNAKDLATFLHENAEDIPTVNNIETITPKSTDNGTITFSAVEPGYYFVDTTAGSLFLLDSVVGDKLTLNDKNGSVTVDKKIKDDAGNFVDNTENTPVNRKIGDTVEFQITVTIPVGSTNVVLHDKMDQGLTLDADSLSANIADSNYDIITNTTDDCTYEIQFEKTYLDSIQPVGDKNSVDVVVSYNAVINEDAIELTKDAHVEQNETWVNFGGNQETTHDWVYVKTIGFDLYKFYKNAQGNEQDLSGATFELRQGENVVELVMVQDGVYRLAKDNDQNKVNTVQAGRLTITGLDADLVYKLVETDAPEGYNREQEPIDVVLGGTVGIENKAGTKLPETGGMGTKVLFTVGGIMMVVAFVLFTSKRRMAAED